MAEVTKLIKLSFKTYFHKSEIKPRERLNSLKMDKLATMNIKTRHKRRE